MSYLIKKLVKKYESLHMDELEKRKKNNKRYFVIMAIEGFVTFIFMFFGNAFNDVKSPHNENFVLYSLTLAIITMVLVLITFTIMLISDYRSHVNYKLDVENYYGDFNDVLKTVFKKSVSDNIDDIIVMIEHQIDVLNKFSIFRNGTVIFMSSSLFSVTIYHYARTSFINIIYIASFLMVVVIVASGIRLMQNASTMNSTKKNLYYIKSDLLELKIMKEHLKDKSINSQKKGLKV